MNLHRRIAAAAVMVLMTACFSGLSAKNKCVPKLYIFGFVASFNDSTVHFTEVQELDSAWINDKNKFLIGREEYSYQLRNYLESKGMTHRTCIISYALKRKDIDKKLNRMRNKNLKRGNVDFKRIPKDEFQFKAVKPED